MVFALSFGSFADHFFTVQLSSVLSASEYGATRLVVQLAFKGNVELK